MDKQELEPQEERMIGKLIHSSGRGPTAPPGARERVYAAVRAEWQRNVHAAATGARRPERGADGPAGWLSGVFRPALALAATAAVAVGIAFYLQPQQPGLVQVAAVSKVVGEVTVAAGRSGQAASVGMGIHAGQQISTAAEGGLGLEFSSGESLRLDAGTTITFADNRVVLESGAVYLDSERASGVAPAVIIDSRFGSVRHIGTQYEARLQSAALHVRVREGAVAIEAAPGRVTGNAGEEIVVPLAGDVLRNEIAGNDPSWQWTEALAVLPDADEYDVTELLSWVARQTGRQLQLDADAARGEAAGLVLRGLGGLTPQETIDVIRDTTELQFRLTAESIVIE